jgi:hypothetical protein
MISLINVFTVDPANQQRLLDLLARATDEFVSRAPGFVSSILHRSLDGTKVAMYAQWRSVEDLSHAPGSRTAAFSPRGAHVRQVRARHVRDRAQILAPLTAGAPSGTRLVICPSSLAG